MTLTHRHSRGRRGGRGRGVEQFEDPHVRPTSRNFSEDTSDGYSKYGKGNLRRGI